MYNVAQYINKCVKSVYAQGFSETEFEIIAINDESPDNSLELIEIIAKQHTNITVISQDNKGLGGARNTGILHAKGKYLLFLDPDDYLLPNSLNDLMEVALLNKLDVLEFGCQGVYPNGKMAYEVSKTTNGKIYNGVNYYNHLKYMNSACNKLYRRNLLIENNILFLEKIYIEDFEFNTRVFYYTNKVMAIKNIAAHYLQSPDSITRNSSKEKKEKMLQDIITVLKLTKAFSNDKLERKQSNDLKTYFGTRFSFLNITLFYQIFKNKGDYNKIMRLKNQLEKEDLLNYNYSVSIFSKDLFRLVFLRNFWLFKITQPLQNILFKI